MMSSLLAQGQDIPPETYGSLIGLIAAAAGLLFLLVLVILIRAYQKTSADKAFVRTGLGRATVVVDGGALVIGLFHQLKWISLETMRLTVDRRGRDALITKDRYRVDITCDFFVRVEANDEQILRASRSLGEYTLTTESVMDLVGAKLVGALRSVAATRTLLDLHEKRDDFADNVQEALHSDLQKNGLTLESVSIVNLDQTEMSAYDQNNVFDAEGLKKIVEETAERQIRKNEIENKARVEMKQQDVEAAIKVKEQDVEGRKKQLDLERDEEIAEATQQKEVEVFKAERTRETQEFKYIQEESVRRREIDKNRSVQEAQIATDLKLSQDGIQKDKAIREAQIQAELKIKRDTIEQQRIIEQAGIEKQRIIEQAGIEKQTFIIEKEREREEAEIKKQTYLIDKQREREEAEISKELALEKARRDKQIGIIQKEQDLAHTEAQRLAVVAEREAAEQNVYLVEQRAEAERNKQVALISQQAESEKEQVARQIAADAEAYETRKRAEAELAASEMRAQAMRVIAAAELVESEARAEGQRKLIEARNSTAEQVLLQEVVLSLIEHSPELMREAMKPAERISDIRVLNVSGMGGSGGSQGEGSIAGKIVSSVLEAGAAWPLLKELMKAGSDSGLEIGELARRAIHSHPSIQKLLEKLPEDLRSSDSEA